MRDAFPDRGGRSPGSAARLLGQAGPFAARLARYEAREGQARVAAAVEAVLERDGVLLCEAGTGIGKTFAYLVPALLSGRKVVISTATKTLQDQIAERDLPLVQEVLGTAVSSVVMKGLSNYVCRRRYREFVLSVEGARPEAQEDLHRIAHFLKATESGDLAGLATLSERSRVRLEVSSSSETRLGARCPDFEQCFVTEMRKAADQAQIVIVNHHLFFADLSLRGPHPGRVLPDYDAVIFDEAHQIEDIAAQFFGARLSQAQLERLLTEVRRLLLAKSPFGGDLDTGSGASLVVRAHQALAALFDTLLVNSQKFEAGRRGKFELSEHCAALSPPLEDALRDLEVVLEGRSARESDGVLRDELEQAQGRLEKARGTLAALRAPEPNVVAWLDGAGRALNLTPVDLAPVLANRLFDSVPAVCLLSATLSTSPKKAEADRGTVAPPPDQVASRGAFSFIRSRLGVSSFARVDELSIPSPFEYRTNCWFYVPRDLPDVKDREFLERAGERAVDLIRASQGGAFLLTTSLASVTFFASYLRQQRLPWPILVQGERPKEVLLGAFRAAGNAVLVATSSFWEGVDVPGQALRLLILEKLPFQVPTDPVYEARGRAIEARGGSPFAELALPSAAITLKQGFGRLLRSSTDRGVVALLDKRLVERPYGKRLLRALPDARLTSELTEVRRVLEEWSQAPADSPSDGGPKERSSVPPRPDQERGGESAFDWFSE